MNTPPIIAVFGASGLIGEAVARDLVALGFTVVPVARRFSAAQRSAFGEQAVERPIMTCDSTALSDLFSEFDIEIAVNCVGVLRDDVRGRTDDVHGGFVARLLNALEPRAGLLIHISIPGDAAGDQTPFSRSKREADKTIANVAASSVVLRPGFVIASSAYGGSAFLRGLAMTPFALSRREAGRPFAVTAVRDIGQTVAVVARRWQNGERRWKAVWDVMARDSPNVGDVLAAFRRHFGGPRIVTTMPSGLLAIGAGLGDVASLLGWSPPIGRTALAEMRRGIEGDPNDWIAATGIEPATLKTALQSIPASVQEKWFARLYLLKPLIVAILVVFWCVSGLIALTVAFESATAILTAHGFVLQAGYAITVLSSLMDITVGLMIAGRRTCRAGLIAGIAVSLFYMIGATIITPDLWFEPLGALVKTFPSIALSLVMLAILEDR